MNFIIITALVSVLSIFSFTQGQNNGINIIDNVVDHIYHIQYKSNKSTTGKINEITQSSSSMTINYSLSEDVSTLSSIDYYPQIKIYQNDKQVYSQAIIPGDNQEITIYDLTSNTEYKVILSVPYNESQGNEPENSYPYSINEQMVKTNKQRPQVSIHQLDDSNPTQRGYSSINVLYNIDDPDNAISEFYSSSVDISIYENDQLIEKKNLNADNFGNNMSSQFNGLKGNTVYSIVITGAYDIDGDGEKDNDNDILAKMQIQTSNSKDMPTAKIYSAESGTEISYDYMVINYDLIDPDHSIVNDGITNPQLHIISEGDTENELNTYVDIEIGEDKQYEFNQLEPETSYYVELLAPYDLNDDGQVDNDDNTVIANNQFKTLPAPPKVNIYNTQEGIEPTTISSNQIEVHYDLTDEYETLLNTPEIAIYKDGDLVESTTATLGQNQKYTFDNLLSDSIYVIQISAQFDLDLDSIADNTADYILDSTSFRTNKQIPTGSIHPADGTDTQSKVTENSIEVHYDLSDPNSAIINNETIKPKLVLYEDNFEKTSKEITVGQNQSILFDGLSSNNNYEVKMEVKYDINHDGVDDANSQPIATQTFVTNKQTPTGNIHPSDGTNTQSTVNQSSIEVHYDLSDPNSAIINSETIKPKLVLYEDNAVKSSQEITVGQNQSVLFDGLSSNNNYQVKMEVKYDTNHDRVNDATSPLAVQTFKTNKQVPIANIHTVDDVNPTVVNSNSIEVHFDFTDKDNAVDPNYASRVRISNSDTQTTMSSENIGVGTDQIVVFSDLDSNTKYKVDLLTEYDIDSNGINENENAQIVESQTFTTTEVSGNPSEIATCQDLQDIGKGRPLDGDYHLVNDIDCTKTEDPNIYGNDGFDPIGSIEKPFTGTFDGNTYTINNLYINDTSKVSVGLFGATSGATLNNVGINNINIISSGSAGGLVGIAKDDTVINTSYTTGEIINNSGSATGGLVGRLMNSEINNSYSGSDVTGSDYTGGLVGQSSKSDMTNVYTTGDIKGHSYVGGLVGSLNNVSGLVEGYATGDVVGGTQLVGTLVGYVADYNAAAELYSYERQQISYDNGESYRVSEYDDFIGLHAGQPMHCDTVSYDELSDPSWYIGIYFSNEIWDISQLDDQGQVVNPKLKSIGESEVTLTIDSGSSDETVHEINSCRDLESIGHGTNYYGASHAASWPLDDDYYLGSDIDCSATNIESPTYQEQYGDDGFNPIGFEDSPFTGTIDGMGYTINGLYINTTKDDTYRKELGSGLFRATSGATVSNITLYDFTVKGYKNVGGIIGTATNTTVENSSVSGYVSGNDTVGLLIGNSISSNIINSSSTGNIGTNKNNYLSQPEMPEYIGGLIGVSTQSNIKNSHADNLYYITDYANYVGGLVGYSDGSVIENCYTTGDLSTYYNETQSNFYGGLAGKAKGSILKNSYSKVDIVGYNNAGGLVGTLEDSTIENCYASGDVKGNNSIGGLVGFVNAGQSQSMIINSFSTSNVLKTYTESDNGGLVGHVENNTTNPELNLLITNSYVFDFQKIENISNGNKYNMSEERIVGSNTKGNVAVGSTMSMLTKDQLLSSEFYIDTLHWDTNIWDISLINQDGVAYLPKLIGLDGQAQDPAIQNS